MQNMESRLKMIGATWDLDAAIGKGVNFNIRLDTNSDKSSSLVQHSSNN